MRSQTKSLIRDPNKTRLSIKALRAEIQKLRHVGQQMSNVCYNYGQTAFKSSPQTVEVCARLAKEWDKIPRNIT